MKHIFYLGPHDSFSHAITKKVFAKQDFQFISCMSFLEIVTNTICLKGSIGVLPIENSITSDIHENIDFVFKNDINIIIEAYLRINLHLVGLPGKKLQEITSVYSHPRAFAQCTQFIKTHHLIMHETTSTAAAKQLILQHSQTNEGAIGSQELAADGKLAVIERNIGNDKYNLTRFVFLSTDQTYAGVIVKNKTTIIFKLPHTPGSLAKILNEFAKAHVNLTKIESRPIPGTSWEYEFWVDIEESSTVLDMTQIVDILRKNALNYKIIGVYQSGKIYES